MMKDLSRYDVSGYGFGNVGPGLTAGVGGPASRPGYPAGTGVCFYQLIIDME